MKIYVYVDQSVYEGGYDVIGASADIKEVAETMTNAIYQNVVCIDGDNVSIEANFDDFVNVTEKVGAYCSDILEYFEELYEYLKPNILKAIDKRNMLRELVKKEKTDKEYKKYLELKKEFENI